MHLWYIHIFNLIILNNKSDGRRWIMGWVRITRPRITTASRLRMLDQGRAMVAWMHRRRYHRHQVRWPAVICTIHIDQAHITYILRRCHRDRRWACRKCKIPISVCSATRPPKVAAAAAAKCLAANDRWIMSFTLPLMRRRSIQKVRGLFG